MSGLPPSHYPPPTGYNFTPPAHYNMAPPTFYPNAGRPAAPMIPGQTFAPTNPAQSSAELQQLRAMAEQLKPLGVQFDVDAVERMVQSGMPMEQAVMQQMAASGLPVPGGENPGSPMSLPGGLSPLNQNEDPNRSGAMVMRDGTVWDTKSNTGGMGFFGKLILTAAALGIVGFGFRHFRLAQKESIKGAVENLNNNAAADFLTSNPVSKWLREKTPQTIKESLRRTGETLKNWLGFSETTAKAAS